jgi:dipeptidyl aminopeptidase/acylaminoacyl peptidase
MKKIVLSLVLLTGICLLVGCYPKRVVWSSDGKWAAVTGTDTLYFCDSKGKITEKIRDGILKAEWFPNEYRLAIQRGIRVNNWQLMEANIPEAKRQKLIQHIKSLSDVNDALEWKIKTDTLVDTKVLSRNEIKGVILYLRDKSPNKLPQTVVDSWPKNINFDYYFMEIGLWKDGKFTTEKTLWSSDEKVWDIRISSKGRVIAFTSVYSDSDEDDGSNYSTLWVADCDTGQVIPADKNVALYPDWSTDGKSLFYVRSISETNPGNVIGTLLKGQICDDSGALLTNTKYPEALAGLIINAYTKVRCLSDGRIVFSSIEVSLPTIGADVPQQKQLFTLDPKRQVTITRLIPRGTLDQAEDYNIDFFEVSPDETMISIPSDEGRVAVFYPSTGEFKVLQAEDMDHVKTVPVWRYPNDLCYVNVNKSTDEKQAEQSKDVVLQAPTEGKEWSEPRSISKSWPSEARDNWLE